MLGAFTRSVARPMPKLPALPELTKLPKLPTLCEVCRGWGQDRVCPDCVARFAQPQARCRCCALPLGLAADRCGECLSDPPPFSRTFCAVNYRFPWDALLMQLKFHGHTELAQPLAQQLHAALPASGVDAVVPVPLSPQRLAQRGYNQAWLLAQAVARLQRVPAWPDTLQRAVDTQQQTELGRSARQRNLRAAFMVLPARRAAIAGKRLALVDDVMTTGATAREAAAALLRAGAADVQLWVVARTPADDANNA